VCVCVCARARACVCVRACVYARRPRESQRRCARVACSWSSLHSLTYIRLLPSLSIFLPIYNHSPLFLFSHLYTTTLLSLYSLVNPLSLFSHIYTTTPLSLCSLTYIPPLPSLSILLPIYHHSPLSLFSYLCTTTPLSLYSLTYIYHHSPLSLFSYLCTTIPAQVSKSLPPACCCLHPTGRAPRPSRSRRRRRPTANLGRGFSFMRWG